MRDGAKIEGGLTPAAIDALLADVLDAAREELAGVGAGLTTDALLRNRVNRETAAAVDRLAARLADMARAHVGRDLVAEAMPRTVAMAREANDALREADRLRRRPPWHLYAAARR